MTKHNDRSLFRASLGEGDALHCCLPLVCLAVIIGQR